MTDLLRCEVKHATAVLTLNRPEKLNALNNELLDAIVATLDHLELDPAVRAIVVTGAGRRSALAPTSPHSSITCWRGLKRRSRILCAPAIG